MAEKMRHMTPEERRSFDEIANRRNKPLSPSPVPTAAEREDLIGNLVEAAIVHGSEDGLDEEAFKDVLVAENRLRAALTEVERQQREWQNTALMRAGQLQQSRDTLTEVKRQRDGAFELLREAMDRDMPITHGWYERARALLSGSPEDQEAG